MFSHRGSEPKRSSRKSKTLKSALRARVHLEELEVRNLLSVYTPVQIRHAYGFDQIKFVNSQGQSVVGDGSNQTIAIVDAFNQPNIASDLAFFDQTFGLPAANLQVVDQNGGSSLPSGDVGWGEEISLDVEWAHAIAPGAKILLVEANSSSGSDLLSAVDYARSAPGVVAVSMSWGGGEFSNESSFDFHFTTPSGHAGVTFVASSGDSGSPAGWPSISPNVVAVGGTSLTLDKNNNIANETAWGGSGGGISPFEAQPSYQSGVVTQSTTNRTNPDVSYNADPNTGVYVYDTFGVGGWLQIGGTSAGSPQWAALVAVADQGRTLNGLNTLQSNTDTLTKLYKLSSSDFRDITSGSNGGFSAGPGYDLVTGLGSPVANRIVADLVGIVNPVTAPATPTNLTATAGNQQNTLTWTPSANAASYNIYRSLTSGGEGATPFKTLVTTSSFIDTGLTNGTTYFYQVTAVNAGGESQKTGEVSATPVAPASAPPAPTNLSATAGDKQVALSWTGSTGATSYNVYRSLTAGGEGTTPFKTGITNTTYTDTGLTDGTTYFYQVTAVNATGESLKSSEVSATPTAPAPTTPTNLVAAAGSQQIALTWTAGANDATYKIYRATTSGFTPSSSNLLGTATTASFTDSNVVAGTTYYYLVTGLNSAGQESAASNQASATVQTAAPSLVLAIAAGGHASGSFVGDADFSGGSVSGGTTATINTSGLTFPPPQSVMQHGRYGNFTYTIPNLTAGATYYVRLDFAEYIFNSAGARVFNVAINGTSVLSNFDIWAAAGGKNIAIAKSFSATASSTGAITIKFTSVVNNSIVSGIEVAVNGPMLELGSTTSLGAASLPQGGMLSRLANIHIKPKLMVVPLAPNQAPGFQGTSVGVSPAVQPTNALNNALIFSNPGNQVLSISSTAANQSNLGSSTSTTSALAPSANPTISSRTPAGYLAPSNDKVKSNSDNNTDSSDSLWFPEIYINPETGEVSVLVVQNEPANKRIEEKPGSQGIDDFFSQEASENLSAASAMPEPDFIVDGAGSQGQEAGVLFAVGAMWMAVARAKDDERKTELSPHAR